MSLVPKVQDPPPWLGGLSLRSNPSTTPKRLSNPCSWVNTDLYNKCFSIDMELNRTASWNEIWVSRLIWARNKGRFKLTVKPKWNLLHETLPCIAAIHLLSHWFYWCPHTVFVLCRCTTYQLYISNNNNLDITELVSTGTISFTVSFTVK